MADRKVCLWNAARGKLLRAHDVDSQVTALLWGHSERELLTAHGYSQNQVSLWRYPTLSKAADLRGHHGRLLGLAQSPDGSLLCSASADETLRLWKVGSPPARQKASSTFALRTIR